MLDVGQDKVTGVRLQNVKSKQETVVDCAGVFVAIGHVPNTQLFKGQIDLDENGYVIPRSGTETNVPGVFVAGTAVAGTPPRKVTVIVETCHVHVPRIVAAIQGARVALPDGALDE